MHVNVPPDFTMMSFLEPICVESMRMEFRRPNKSRLPGQRSTIYLNHGKGWNSFDLMVALLRKIEAGKVRTGWTGDQWDEDNPVRKVMVLDLK
jgi:hypothetical protein